MAEYYSKENQLTLSVEQKYSNTLDMDGFMQMMKDPSYCYKFYWLEALVILVSEGVRETTFDAMINEMIANAWYSVREFHIHLSGLQMGAARDGLERAVNLLADLSGLPSNASKTEIKNEIEKLSDNTDLKRYKVQLTNMVPYRALAGFFRNAQHSPNWESAVRMTAYIDQINQINRLPYTLGNDSRLKKQVYISDEWAGMIEDNTVAILGWIRYEKVKWLQMNNPEVPGLVYKLEPMDDKMRKLGQVRKLWDAILEFHAVHDVFTDREISIEKYDVDHFIPWSFVMNDELWNLEPMDSSLNSSKSNRLPQWDPFFARFAENQFLLYELIQTKEPIRKQFERCYKDNLHSIWASQELYRKGNSKEDFFNILNKNMRPVYDSARRQGYDIWKTR